ncbi:MAG TPA: alkaline phosphatase family protein [Turneriella sp.]|nr:alkaline phosphatase family protein [Turneriella sp.]
MLPNRTTTFVRIEGRYFFFLFWAASLLSLFSIVRTHKNIDTFPYHADYEIHNSDPGIDEGLWREKAAQYIFLVVVDNLTESDIAAMPRFTELRKKAALFSLKAPFPSLSLPAYTTLLTGAPPTITGISSDDNETIDARIDSLPRRLKAAGWKTAVVGSTVWLNYFENDFDLGAVDSFYNRKSKFFKERNSTNAGESKGRSVLWHGVYQPTPDGWRRFIQRYNIAYNFGDDVATAEVEDTSRTRKAIALWKKEGVDFVLLHLQTPPHSALAELDLNFQRVADAVKLQTSILAVVPAHGAKKMLWGTYHGGDEKTVRRVP